MADEVQLPWYKRVSEKWLNWAVNILLIAALGYLLGRPAAPVPLPPDEPIFMAKGAILDEKAEEAFQSTLQFKSFGETPAGQAKRADAADVYLGEAARAAIGGLPEEIDQGNIGTCVGCSMVWTAEIGETADMVAAKQAGKPVPAFKPLSVASMYGGARVEIGNKKYRMNLRGDGAVGAHMQEYLKDYGLAPAGKYGNLDVPRYSISQARDWGNKGVPADVLAEAKKNPVQMVVPCKTTDELADAIRKGFPAQICSSVAYVMGRNSDGICELNPRDSWAHALACDGVMMLRGERLFHIQNSWGIRAHTGPLGWGNPSPGGFWARDKAVAVMLREKSCYAFDVNAFKRRVIDWEIVKAPEPFRADLKFAFNARSRSDASYSLGF